MNNISISIKIYTIVAILVIMFMLFILIWVLPIVKEVLYQERMMALRPPVDMVYNYLDTLQNKVETNQISKDDAKRKIFEIVSSLKYDGGKNYVWINDDKNVFIYHPNPKNIGADFTEKADINGVRFIYEITKVTKENGEGYIEYSFPKPDNLNLPLPKKSFGKYHRYWNYVVATGAWIDDIEKSVDDIRNKVILGSIIGIIISVLIAYYIGRTIINPIKQVKDKLLKLSEGQF